MTARPRHHWHGGHYDDDPDADRLGPAFNGREGDPNDDRVMIDTEDGHASGAPLRRTDDPHEPDADGSGLAPFPLSRSGHDVE